MSWSNLVQIMNRVSDLNSASAIMGWDQETYMPDGAVEARSEQLGTISALSHHYLTNEEAQRAVEEFKAYSSTLSDRQQRVGSTFAKDHAKALRLPESLVVEQARVASLAQDAWKKARQANDFSMFRPHLERTVELKRQEAELLGPSEHPYDALMDAYEPGLKSSDITPIFERLRTGTVELLSNINSLQSNVSDEVLHRTYPKDMQLSFAQRMIDTLGFSRTTGRVDLSAHPFCTSFANTDVRLTTRVREQDLRSCLFGLIHEAGHGMYEQGVAKELVRTPSGQGASMGIHESQSLFWENVIARSEHFWDWAFPKLKEVFPRQLADQDAKSFYKAINKMIPSLNRVESDELTYNFHIILRFEFERGLIDGSIQVKDIPSMWMEKMQSSLGVVPPNDAEGCLQDVHWSIGLMGYFPSYTLGKLYAAMLWNSLKQAQPNVESQIANGEFSSILGWLRTNIHDYGRTETPDEIIRRVCGRPLTEVDFLSYVTAKAKSVYGF